MRFVYRRLQRCVISNFSTFCVLSMLPHNKYSWSSEFFVVQSRFDIFLYCLFIYVREKRRSLCWILQKSAFLTWFTTFQDLHLKWGWVFIVFFLGGGVLVWHVYDVGHNYFLIILIRCDACFQDLRLMGEVRPQPMRLKLHNGKNKF